MKREFILLIDLEVYSSPGWLSIVSMVSLIRATSQNDASSSVQHSQNGILSSCLSRKYRILDFYLLLTQNSHPSFTSETRFLDPPISICQTVFPIDASCCRGRQKHKRRHMLLQHSYSVPTTCCLWDILRLSQAFIIDYER